MSGAEGSRPRVGISRCLLGDEVRYDGGHKREAALLDALGSRVEWLDICPEIEVGMGVPREPIQLVAGAGQGSRLRLAGVRTGEDWTDRMTAWGRQRLEHLATMSLSGFVLKARSPSCGLSGVPVLGAPFPSSRGRGLFAAALTERFPDLPVADEEALRDPDIREAFLARVLAYRARLTSG
jgi:uncharacterized protein YbbK (DUF523 family)